MPRFSFAQYKDKHSHNRICEWHKNTRVRLQFYMSPAVFDVSAAAAAIVAAVVVVVVVVVIVVVVVLCVCVFM